MFDILQRYFSTHKMSYVFSFSLLFLMSALVFIPFRVSAATTYDVCESGCDFTSISNALASSSVESGDTITVGATYASSTETFPLTFADSNLTLECESGAIIGGSMVSTTIYITTSSTVQNCSFDSVTISDPKDFPDAVNITIQNNTFSTSTTSTINLTVNGEFAIGGFNIYNNVGLQQISISNYTTGTIRGNEIYNYNSALSSISLYGSNSGIMIDDNTLNVYSKVAGAINITDAEDITITGNTVIYPQYVDVTGSAAGAINLTTVTSTMISYNYLDTHLTDAKPVYISGTSTDAIIINNTMSYSSSSAGIYIIGKNDDTHTVTSTYNIFYNASDEVGNSYGIDIIEGGITNYTLNFINDYNGFWNLNTNVSTTTISLGSNTRYNNPFFRIGNVSSADDLLLAPSSEYRDVNGELDIGADSGLRRNAFFIDDDGTIDYSAVDFTSIPSDFSTYLRTGDTLNFAAGTYTALSLTTTTVATSSLTITGIGATTIFDASTNENAVSINGFSDSTLQDFTTQNASSTTQTASISVHPFDYATSTVVHSYISPAGPEEDLGYVSLLYGTTVDEGEGGLSDIVNVTVGVHNVATYLNEVGDDPQDWHLALLSGDMGEGTKYHTVYHRNDVFSDRQSAVDIWEGFTVDYWATSTFTYSDGAYTYHIPPAGSIGPTPTTTYQSGTPSIDITNNYYSGIKLNNTNDILVQNVTSTHNAYGVWFNGDSTDNNVSSTVMSDNTTYDIYSDSTGNNNLKNLTFNSASSSIAGTGNVNTYFKARTLVTSTNAGLEGADVNFVDASSGQSTDLTTLATGYTAYTDYLLGWTMTSSTPNSVTAGSYNPFTITASATSTYSASSTDVNIIEPNQLVTLTMSEAVVAAPGVVTGLTATAVSTSQINLAWTAVSGAIYYNIYNSSDSYATAIATTTGLTYSATGLSSGTSYSYKVSATNNTGEGNKSAIASATTQTDPVASTSSGGSSFIPPTLPVVENNFKIEILEGTQVDSTKITLKFTGVSDVSQIAISENESFSNSSWTAYSATKTFVLSSKKGQKTIHVKFRTSKGGVSSVYTKSIALTVGEEVIDTTEKPEQTETTTKPTVKPTTKYTFNNYLYIGSTGQEVRNLQTLLKELGYFTYPTITGYFGNITKQAVVLFQKDKNLSPYPGWLGPETRKTLNEISGDEILKQIQDDKSVKVVEKKSTTKYTFNNYLYIGSTGQEVRNLQTLLKELGYFTYPTITGYFGNITKQAVVLFQKDKNLSPYPGWLGPGTRKTLNSL